MRPAVEPVPRSGGCPLGDFGQELRSVPVDSSLTARRTPASPRLEA